MARFWWLMGLAFVDLVVAGVMIGRGHASLAYLFLLMALATGGLALFLPPPPRRDARGRLQPAELPYGKLIGVVGALAILGSAAYVATISSSPAARPAPARVVPPVSPAAAPAYARPAPARPAPRPQGLLYKCVAADGHASYQSEPCPERSQQAWVRDATPEAGPTAAQLAQQRRRQALEAERARRQAASSNRGYWEPPQEHGGSKSLACKAARAADAAYRRQPLKYVTHDGLRRHGDAVLAACS
ncbi:DUF4124 domain-containing protein [Arenimonas sp.]|uniref:DUF4124 domain-containing protein n=1 Tax=Arenimonas sp. TaxID=1872635 RepID=UPI0035B06C69